MTPDVLSDVTGGLSRLPSPGSLISGVSISDACIGWERTETLLAELYDAMTSRC